MERAAAESRWDHTSSLIAATLNAGLRPGRVLKPDQFHPFRKSRPLSVAEAIRMMRPANGGQQGPDEQPDRADEPADTDRTDDSPPPTEHEQCH